MNVRLACFTFSFFEELLAMGADREYAIEPVADATWQVYRTWARLTSATAHLVPGKSAALAFPVSTKGDSEGKMHLRFPFNAPGYLIETVPTERGTAFDVVHCPVATYFRERLLDLALGAPGNATRALFLVAPDEREAEVCAQLHRPAFQRIGDLRVRFLPYGEIERHRESMARLGQGLKAIDPVARDLT